MPASARPIFRCLARSAEALKQSPALAVGVLAWAIAVVALLYRLPFGSATLDEAYYSAMAYGFVLGQKPYVEELTLHQNAAFLVSLLCRVYVWFKGSDGIILFSRWLYVAYVGFCSFLVYRVGSRLCDRVTGCWSAALLTTWSYYNLFALSYNTQGAFGLVAGALLSVLGFYENRRRNLFLAGVFLVSAAFCYPPLALVVLPYVAVLARCLQVHSSRAELRGLLLWLALGLAAAALPCLAFFAWATPEGLRRGLEFSRALGYAGSALERFHIVPGMVLWPQRWYFLTFGLVFTAIPILVVRLKSALPLTLLVPPLLLAMYWKAGGEYQYGTVPFETMLAVVAPASLLQARSYSRRWLVLALLWLPGLGAMLLSAYSSANGLFAVNLGALLPTAAGVIGLSALLAEIRGAQGTARAPAVFFATFCGTVLAIQIWSLYGWVFEGLRFREATTRVRTGPNRGTYTSPSLAKMLETVHQDLKSIEEPGKTVLMFDGFMPAYLSTRMRPRTFTHWGLWSADSNFNRAIMDENYLDPAKQPDFVLLEGTAALDRGHPWKRYEYNYEVILRRPEFGYILEKRVRIDPLPSPRPRNKRRPRPEKPPS